MTHMTLVLRVKNRRKRREYNTVRQYTYTVFICGFVAPFDCCKRMQRDAWKKAKKAYLGTSRQIIIFDVFDLRQVKKKPELLEEAIWRRRINVLN